MYLYTFIVLYFFFQNINNKKDVQKKYLKNESVSIVQINFQIQTHFFFMLKFTISPLFRKGYIMFLI